METKEKSDKKKSGIVIYLFMMATLCFILPFSNTKPFVGEFAETNALISLCASAIILSMALCLSSIQNLIETNKE